MMEKAREKPSVGTTRERDWGPPVKRKTYEARGKEGDWLVRREVG